MRRLTALHEAVARPNDLSLIQGVQLYALTREFAPDLIIELGRGYGNSTCVFGEVLSDLGKGRLLSISNDSERAWETKTIPRLRGLISPDWLRRVTIVQGDIENYDLVSTIQTGQRILVFWDAHGFELAYHLLSSVMPSLQPKEHLVVVHDMTDTRYVRTKTPYVKSETPRLWLSWINSNVEEFLPLYEFLSRNEIWFDSPGDSAHRFVADEIAAGGEGSGLQRTWESLFPSSAVDRETHWIYFSLNERNNDLPLAFPPRDMNFGKMGGPPPSTAVNSSGPTKD